MPRRYPGEWGLAALFQPLGCFLGFVMAKVRVRVRLSARVRARVRIRVRVELGLGLGLASC